ncbi:pollen-specific leucine-rich repeat extensin-like protein 1 [Vitis vinifera]|uniref:pollen-specific leucine-rich repeat extensin-like protein 1 n=1 Tax=Vitis vinifera TaxID=29760 RepID=UPI002882DBD4|nr:pollen-specific leucine-rich repeat extensin-like protein 1 [Vitis vinifera]XP_059597287.1 pollen-specific leucine-rich repeat extensin-like protein 1 [Vitis vinifera]XP_059597291.1 pollen-specific leucine-rich repeat extensin-like protein 1 [Vitis vinifera]
MLFKGGVLSSVGWQHHPPRHAAARAALGVQAAHATLGMAPPHMPPSSPRHANAKRARPRHRGEPSHATAVTPCPVHAAPRTRPMPPMRTRPPPPCNECPPRALGPVPPRLGSTPRASMLPRKNVPMANVAARPGGLTHASRPTLPIKRHTDAPPPMQRVPSPCTRPRLGSPRSPRASMLPRKSLPMASVAAHPGGSPMPPARRCPSKGTRMPLPPMQREPSPGARPLVSARRGALKPSSEHVASEKTCQWPTSRLTPGAHPCPPPDVAHRKAHGCPSPPCKECPTRVLGPPSRLVEEPSSPRASMLPRKKRASGQRRGSPRGLTHAPRPTLPIERHTDAPPPHATSALPGHSAPSRLVEEPSSERVLPPKGARRIVAMPISVLRRLHSLLPCAGQESPPDESRFDA